jgi:DUF3068 family protein
MMRRNIGLVLAGLGAFLIVLAVVLPTWIVAQVVKFPLNEYQSATLAASDASYFSAKSLTEKTGVNLQATYTIKGDGKAGTSSTAVWDEYSYVYDKTNHYAVQQMARRFAFDRKTGQLTMCCGANVNGDSSVQQRGLVGYVFPFGTKKQTYQVFDTTLNKPVPFTYKGTATVGGIKTYKFVEDVPPTKIGFSPLSSTQPEYYQIHLTYWVDPVTGALLNVNEDQKIFLQDPATGAQTTVLFGGDLQATPASVKQIVKLDSDGRNKLSLLGTILPIVLGILGAAALIAGIVLARKPREEEALAAPESAVDAAETPAAPAPWERDDASADVIPGLETEEKEPEKKPAE